MSAELLERIAVLEQRIAELEARQARTRERQRQFYARNRERILAEQRERREPRRAEINFRRKLRRCGAV